MNPNPAQMPVTFAPQPTAQAEKQKKKLVRRGAAKRYDKALEFLRGYLSPVKYEHIDSIEFAKLYEITGTFLNLVTLMGGLDYYNTKGGYMYRVLPGLYDIDGKKIITFRKENKVTKLPYQPAPVLPQPLVGMTRQEREDFVHAMNTMPSLPQETLDTVKFILEPADEIVESPVFLVGMIANDTTLEAATVAGQQFGELLPARTRLQNWPVAIGTKLVIVQVIEVVQSSIALQPATL